ncbi:MAG: outer-membrane lipoprotein carrier protein LolA [Bacteroidales bacterium]|nr:outer-membrane lipoprotein carrier protein LolA [Bacteroidales bacterium]
MKKLMLFFCSVFTLYGLVAQTEIKNGVVVDHGAQKIIDNASKKLKNDVPLSFTVAYEITSNGKTAEKGKADFLSTGNKYRVLADDFEDYCNAKSLWHYDKKTKEVELSDLEDGKSIFNFTKIIDTYAKSFRPKLIRKDYLGKTQVNIIDLSPQRRSSITKVRLWISTDNNTIMKMQVNLNDDSKNIYTFSNYKTKVKATDSDFVFPKSKYPNVKVVDLR